MKHFQPILARVVSWAARRICRLHFALQRRRTRAALASLSPYELRDIGLSHADGALVREASCT